MISRILATRAFLINYPFTLIVAMISGLTSYIYHPHFLPGYSNQDTMQLKNVIDHNLYEMDIWSKKWLMSFNPDKTEIMIFSNPGIPENLDFMFKRCPNFPQKLFKHIFASLRRPGFF